MGEGAQAGLAAAGPGPAVPQRTLPTKVVKKRWYSTNLGERRCSSTLARLSRVGRAMMMAFMCPTDSGCGDSRFSTRKTCLDRMSCMEVTMDTMVLVSLSSSRHFMPEMAKAGSRGLRMRMMSARAQRVVGGGV